MSWLWEWYVSHDRKCAGRKLRGKICRQRLQDWRLVREVKRLPDVPCREELTGPASLHHGSYESSHSLQNCLWKKKTKCRTFFFTLNFSSASSVLRLFTLLQCKRIIECYQYEWQSRCLHFSLVPSKLPNCLISSHLSVGRDKLDITPLCSPGV